jgi:hypothetical protein
VLHRWGGGSGAQKNKSVSPLLPHRWRPSRRRLKGLLQRVLFDPSNRQLCLLATLRVWRDLFLSVSLASASGRDEVVSLERGCWSGGGGYLPFFSDCIDGRRQFLVQDSTRTSPGRRATTTCASRRTTGLFIDSKSLVGDGALLDLDMVEAWRFFRRASRRSWSWTTAASFGGCRKP